MKTLLVLFVAILAQCFGDAFLTRGMKEVGEVDTLAPRELLEIGVEVFSTPYIWLGVGLLATFFGLYLVALSWADLSFVLPVTAFGYVANAAVAWALLGERVPPLRWVGTLIICGGVAVVSRTEQRTTGGGRGGDGA